MVFFADYMASDGRERQHLWQRKGKRSLSEGAGEAVRVLELDELQR
jgi:hypothetical protein